MMSKVTTMVALMFVMILVTVAIQGTLFVWSFAASSCS